MARAVAAFDLPMRVGQLFAKMKDETPGEEGLGRDADESTREHLTGQDE